MTTTLPAGRSSSTTGLAGETVAGPAIGIAEMSREQKLAGLLLMLSGENAAHILKQLSESELEQVSLEMTRLPALDRNTQAGLLREFSGVAVEAATAIGGGARAEQLLHQALGQAKAADLLGKVAPVRPTTPGMRHIAELDSRYIYHLLRGEKAQTIALVASHLAREKASQVLSLLPAETRQEVVERLATMESPSAAVVESVAEALRRNLRGERPAPAGDATGGVKAAAEVLNALPRDDSKTILLSLRERQPELERELRKQMFTFEELEPLDARVLQKILQNVDSRSLTVALKGASEKLTNKLLSCISKRAAENVREEIEYLGPLKLSEIEAAQMQIIEAARQLEADGEIDLEEARQRART